MTDRAIKFWYTNYRGETSLRTMEPSRIEFRSTEFHPEEQWIIHGWDVDKNAWRDYALRDCDFARVHDEIENRKATGRFAG